MILFDPILYLFLSVNYLQIVVMEVMNMTTKSNAQIHAGKLGKWLEIS